MAVSRGVPGLGGCTWSGGVNLVWGVPGPRGYLVPGGVPGPGGCIWSQGTWSGGCTWSRGCTWSGMCTWSRGCTWSQGGVPGPASVPGPGGCTWSGGLYLVRYSPPCGQTHACKNITFATSLRTVKTDLVLKFCCYQKGTI